MLLDDEELPVPNLIPPGGQPNFYLDISRGGAKAQLKKVVEWLPKKCTEHTTTVMMMNDEVVVDMSHQDCSECMQSLLDEVKDETIST